ncbi:hypothetical protein ADL25_16005 [Streptomyces sp. NRRL F-5122]|nr:hypothetical protein ADL25_16005 [Streptomyces sp. NRRL F-5122]
MPETTSLTDQLLLRDLTSRRGDAVFLLHVLELAPVLDLVARLDQDVEVQTQLRLLVLEGQVFHPARLKLRGVLHGLMNGGHHALRLRSAHR